MYSISTVAVLRRLYRGEILEYQSRKYILRGDRVPTKLGRTLVRNGLVEPPPDLFPPIGGRITAAGIIELTNMEQRND